MESISSHAGEEDTYYLDIGFASKRNLLVQMQMTIFSVV